MSGNRLKVVLALPDELAVMSLGHTGIYEEFSRLYEVHALVYPFARLAGLDESQFASVTYVDAKPERNEIRGRQSYLSMWAERHSTQDWDDAARRYFLMQLRKGNRNQAIEWTIRYILPGMIPAVGRWLIRRAEKRLGLDPQVHAMLSKIQPDIVISVFRGHGTTDIDTLKAAQALGIPTFFLQGMWDSICDYGKVQYFADYFGAWGYQAAMWVHKIHDVRKSRIMLTGSPFREVARRRDVDAVAAREYLGLPADKKVIFFAGAANPSYELDNLKLIDDAIESGELGDCVLYYRPHPYRTPLKGEKNYLEMNFRHVVFDHTLVERFQEYWKSNGSFVLSRKGSERVRDNVHASRILAATSVLVGQITTLQLEGLLCGIPNVEVAYVHRDQAHFSVRYSFCDSSEFQWMPGVVIAYSPEDLCSRIRAALSLREDPSFQTVIDGHLQSFVYMDDRTYGQRITDAIEAIVRKPQTSLCGHLNYPAIDVDRGENVID